jgi:hypothetical protein
MTTKIVHCMRDKYDVYIGRYNARYNLPASKWASPFPLPKLHSESERYESVSKYWGWILLPEQKYLIHSLPELNDKILGCWCAPRLCHGDVLIELLARIG